MCNSCRHAVQRGPTLCCAHPRERDRGDLGPRAAVLVWRDRCGGKGYEARAK